MKDIGQEAQDLIREIKSMGWSSIQLTRRGYRGGIATYRTAERQIVPVFFYLDEAYTIGDELGLFGVQDLKYSLQDNKDINLEESGRIAGLKLVAYKESGEIKFVEPNLEVLGIGSEEDREDIAKRLDKVSELGAEVEVEIG